MNSKTKAVLIAATLVFPLFTSHGEAFAGELGWTRSLLARVPQLQPASRGRPSARRFLSSEEAPSPAATPEGYLWVFGGLEAGPTWVTTKARGEADQNGYQLRPKLLASYYLNESWAFDAGFGWTIFTVDTEDKATTVATRAGFFELSPKWRPTSRWQVGLAVDGYFGTDLSFATSYNSPNLALFAGPAAAFDLAVATSWKLRLTGIIETDLNVSDRQIWMGIFGLQVGLPIDKLK